MYTVKVQCRRKGIIRYLTFEDYTEASNCIMAIKGVLTGHYTASLYFEVARITREPLGEVLNEVALETDLAYNFEHRTEKKRSKFF